MNGPAVRFTALQFFAHALDMHIHRSGGIARKVKPPDMLQQLFAGKHLARMRGEKIEDFELFGRHVHSLSLIPAYILPEGNRKPREGERVIRLLLTPARAADHGLHARDQFLGVKRLGDIVIGAQFKAQDLVKGLILGREHDHRNLARAADGLEHFDAVRAGHHDIQQHKVRRKAPEACQCIIPASCAAHFIAFLFQVQLHQLAYALIIVCQKNAGFFFHPDHLISVSQW